MEQNVNLTQSFFSPHVEKTKQMIKKAVGASGVSESSKNLPPELRLLAEGQIKPAYLEALLQHASRPEEWLDICYQAEPNAPVKELEQLWLSGLEKFSNSVLYLENLGYFYYKKGKYHKALEYLAKSHTNERSFFALTVAIAAAYAVTQYHLVLDYYGMLSTPEKNKLDEDMLTRVATAALHQGAYELSADLFTLIRTKNKAPELPTLEKSLKDKFGSMKKMENWVGEIEKKCQSKKDRQDISLNDWITFASVLIHNRQYKEALTQMETVKKELFG